MCGLEKSWLLLNFLLDLRSSLYIGCSLSVADEPTPKKSPVSGHRSASKIGTVTRIIYFIFFANREIHDTCTHRDQIPHKVQVWWLREVSQIGQTQHGRMPINPPILAAIEHRFITNKKKILNVDKRGDQKTLLVHAYAIITHVDACLVRSGMTSACRLVWTLEKCNRMTAIFLRKTLALLETGYFQMGQNYYLARSTGHKC